MPPLLRLLLYGRCPAPCRVIQPCPDHPETFGIAARLGRALEWWRRVFRDGGAYRG